MTDNNNLCLSCSHEKEYKDKTLCKYCYFRGNESTMKMIILDILNSSSVRLSKFDIQDAFNVLPYIGYPMHIKDIEALLLRYKCIDRKIKDKRKKKKYFCLISGRKDTTKGPASGGRKLLMYTITIKGKRWLSRAKKRWKQGNPIHVPRKNKKETKFRMTTDYLERASAIRGKIGKDPKDGGYDTYKFIFARRRNL